MISYFFPSLWRPAFFTVVDRNFPISFVPSLWRPAISLPWTETFLSHFFRGVPSYTKLLHLIDDYGGPLSKMVILVRSFPLAGDFLKTFFKNWQDISLYWWHKSLVGTLFGVLSPDHVRSLCLAWPTKPRLLGHYSAVEAEHHPSATYDFCLLLGNWSIGIKTTTQFLEAQLDWSRQILLL